MALYVVITGDINIITDTDTIYSFTKKSHIA